ncbi:hypothetical protein VKS41_001994 [Umbelopsis sp. WA50703]
MMCSIYKREAMLSRLRTLELKERRRTIKVKSAMFERVVSATWVTNLALSVKWASPWI